MGAPAMDSGTKANPTGKVGKFKKFFRKNSWKNNNNESKTHSSQSQTTSNGTSETAKTSLASRRSLGRGKKNKRGLLGMLPVANNKTEETTIRDKSPSRSRDGPPPVPLQHESMHLTASLSNPQIAPHGENGMAVERIESIRPINSVPSSHVKSVGSGGSLQHMTITSAESHRNASSAELPLEQIEERGPASPEREGLFQWQDKLEQQEERTILLQKQLIKERDGFCRRVDAYDGSVIHVEGKPAYELGSYLGGGVAGVVYEGHRLLGPEEYPVRLGLGEEKEKLPSSIIEENRSNIDQQVQRGNVCLCFPAHEDDAIADNDVTVNNVVHTGAPAKERMEVRDGSLLTMDSIPGNSLKKTAAYSNDVALEATELDGNKVIIDSVDAPNRSKTYAKAVASHTANNAEDFPSDASFVNGFMEETVAVKILNPVGFRALSSDVTNSAVIAREGAQMAKEVYAGLLPMEEKHVWWLINPSSRNLRTLQRYTADGGAPAGVQVDRGSAEKGLRISLIAAYKDADGVIKELPLTRCIEIWGHVPFEATDDEFRDVMTAIDRVNQGLPPPPVPAFMENRKNRMIMPGSGVPGRVGTATSSLTGSLTNSLDDMKLSTKPPAMTAKRTGIYRAAYTERQTVFCSELEAYIAIPAVPSKYLKWLRQRRAATKEVRNMMKLGRHRNVVHLFEVLELIQETKSTMFLILELVRGGELFDLISSNTAKISSTDVVPEGFSESETVMRKFFVELISGIFYCHANFIAHRDLKPENLLVHYDSTTSDCTLKIADFGLSAVYGPNGEAISDQDTIIESLASGPIITKIETSGSKDTAPSPAPSPLKQQMDKLFNVGGSAFSFLTCGAVEDVFVCGPGNNVVETEGSSEPATLKRMTSVVGSPHYVAPEIISQQDNKRSKKKSTDSQDVITKGYDGTKADVWSAGVILYAMLFRSLPFGEDLLRCPRYQSFKKWYDDVRTTGGPRCRRGNLMSPLNPIITEMEKEEMLGPHWFFPSDSSSESKDLIVYMLNPDPDKRPSIDLVLKHPWILKQAS